MQCPPTRANKTKQRDKTVPSLIPWKLLEVEICQVYFQIVGCLFDWTQVGLNKSWWSRFYYCGLHRHLPRERSTSLAWVSFFFVKLGNEVHLYHYILVVEYMIFLVSNLLTLALVCWARYIEDRDIKAITSKSFVLITSSFALTQWRKRSLQLLDLCIPRICQFWHTTD